MLVNANSTLEARRWEGSSEGEVVDTFPRG